jgi:hypothetical protein
MLSKSKRFKNYICNLTSFRTFLNNLNKIWGLKSKVSKKNQMKNLNKFLNLKDKSNC